MLAILNSLNAHNFPIFQPILMILVSKFMVQRALFDKTYLSLGLLSPLKVVCNKENGGGGGGGVDVFEVLYIKYLPTAVVS